MPRLINRMKPACFFQCRSILLFTACSAGMIPNFRIGLHDSNVALLPRLPMRLGRLVPLSTVSAAGCVSKTVLTRPPDPLDQRMRSVCARGNLTVLCRSGSQREKSRKIEMRRTPCPPCVLSIPKYGITRPIHLCCLSCVCCMAGQRTIRG